MFLFSIRQYLCPIILIPFAKNPTAIIFNLEHNYSDLCHYNRINLRILSTMSFHIQIVIYCYRGDIVFKQFEN